MNVDQETGWRTIRNAKGKLRKKRTQQNRNHHALPIMITENNAGLKQHFKLKLQHTRLFMV